MAQKGKLECNGIIIILHSSQLKTAYHELIKVTLTATLVRCWIDCKTFETFIVARSRPVRVARRWERTMLIAGCSQLNNANRKQQRTSHAGFIHAMKQSSDCTQLHNKSFKTRPYMFKFDAVEKTFTHQPVYTLTYNVYTGAFKVAVKLSNKYQMTFYPIFCVCCLLTAKQKVTLTVCDETHYQL